jgi:hypothetical protein
MKGKQDSTTLWGVEILPTFSSGSGTKWRWNGTQRGGETLFRILFQIAFDWNPQMQLFDTEGRRKYLTPSQRQDFLGAAENARPDADSGACE